MCRIGRLFAHTTGLCGAAVIASLLVAPGPVSALSSDPETGQLQVRLPQDLCEFDELPFWVLEALAELPQVNRFYRYAFNQCPEIAAQFADLATGSGTEDKYDGNDEDRDDRIRRRRPDEPTDPGGEEEDDDEVDDDDEITDPPSSSPLF